MTLVLLKNEDLFHFQSIGDAEIWILNNPTTDEVVVLPDEDETVEFQNFLEQNCPIEIIKA